MKEIFIFGFLASLFNLADKFKEGMALYVKNPPIRLSLSERLLSIYFLL